MDLRRRLPPTVLAVVALALTAVIVSRVSAGADPAPQDLRPIVISPAASPTPPATTTTPSSDDDGDDDDDYEREVPEPKDIDDGDDHSGKGRGGDDDHSGRDHPEDD